MDKKFIKALIESGKKFSEIPQKDAMEKLVKEIVKVYTLNGLQRNMSPEAFSQEISACAMTLYEDLMTDTKYKSIRNTEISYIFSNGMKGRLGTDKDIVLTYKSLIRWVEGYVSHRERLAAVTEYMNESYVEPARQLPRRVFTEEDTWRSINRALEDYLEYKNQKPKAGRGGQPRRLFDTAVPYLIKDISGAFIEYMLKHGYAKEGEVFLDVLDRAVANGGKFLKLDNQQTK